MTMTEKQKLGAWGEEQAALFLIKNDYEIVDRNYRQKQGEIDIICWHEKAHHGRTLCFVEVKTRGISDGSAERATQGKKMPRMLFTARQYCLSHHINIETTPIQFEQVSVFPNGDDSPGIRHRVILVE